MYGGVGEGECPLSTDQLVDAIYVFIEMCNKPAGIEIYAYQELLIRRLIEALLVRDGSILTGLWCRQSGKSEAVSSVCWALALILPMFGKAFPKDDRVGLYREGFSVGVFAPKLKQSGIIYDRIRTRSERESSHEIYADPDLQVGIRQSRGDVIAWTNGSFVSSNTASEQSNVEGGTYHLIILDEAQLISHSKVEKEILPMLASTNGVCAMIGTVSYTKGAFSRQIEVNEKKAAEGKSRCHFQFEYKVVIAQKRAKYEESGNPFHLNYEKFVLSTLERLGGNEDNDEFRMNFRLLWPESERLAIDPDCFLDAANALYSAGTVDLTRRRVAGLDFGKSVDSSIVTVNEIGDVVPYNILPIMSDDSEPKVFYQKTIVGWKKSYGRWRQQIPEIVEYLREMQVDVLVADATGLGDPLVEQLQDLMPGVTVIGYVFSLPKKDALYKHYIDELESGRQDYAACADTVETAEYAEFVEQHEHLQKSYRGNYLSPSAEEGYHDDFPDSGALACWASRFEPDATTMAECDDNPFLNFQASSGTQSHRSERYR